MTTPNTLLPSGFYDVLAPDAAHHAAMSERLITCFAQNGYARIAPPIMEFEETLLGGPGASLNRATFRVMDGLSQRMLGLRTDHTLQIGRIAATRLQNQPRPLRLSYAGIVASTVNSDRDPARQKTQTGFELLGSLSAEADAEAIQLSVNSLKALGVTAICVDLLLPTFIPALAEANGLDAELRKKLHHALDRKDEAGVRALGTGAVFTDIIDLLRASGKADTALKMLREKKLPEKAAVDRDRLEKVVALLRAQNLDAEITIDLVEYRGFEYQTGLSFTLFSKIVPVELGRGGRYRTQSDEPATGFTFYMDALQKVVPHAPASKRILIPFALDAQKSEKLVADGYVLVRHWDGACDSPNAKKQGCDFVWQNEKVMQNEK
jgi:ATP phosphoribosyltransferase regulatory subunit